MPQGEDLTATILDTVAQYAREHPRCTIAELSELLPGDGQALVMEMKVGDLWPLDLSGVLAPPVRVAKLQAWITEGARKTFTATEVMGVLECSRNTALRTISRIPNIRTEGKASSAKYVVS